MNNLFKFTLAASALTLLACSNDITSGATIDPSVVHAGGNIPEEYYANRDAKTPMNIAFKTKPTSTGDIDFSTLPTTVNVTEGRQSDNGAILDSVKELFYSGEELGQVVSCYIDDESVIGKLRVYDNGAVMHFDVRASGDFCERVHSLFDDPYDREYFIPDSVYKKGSGWFTNESCEDGKFSYNYMLNADEGVIWTEGFRDTVMRDFEDVMYNKCVSFEFSYDDHKISATAAKAALENSYKRCGDDLLSIGDWRVAQSDAQNRTLSRYASQFTGGAAGLSFDSHVLAYNENPGHVCMLRKDLKSCFEIYEYSENQLTQNKNCKLYIVQDKNAKIPMGHVVSKISKGSIEVTDVELSCGPTVDADNEVLYLVQDCEGLLNDGYEITHKKVTSQSMLAVHRQSVWYREDIFTPDPSSSYTLSPAMEKDVETLDDLTGQITEGYGLFNTSFDSHVLAYDIGACYESDDSNREIAGEIDRATIKRCYPKVAAAMEKKTFGDECKFYTFKTMNSVSPNGIHVWENISKGEVHVVYISEADWLAVGDVQLTNLLVEDCEGLLEDGFVTYSYFAYSARKLKLGLALRADLVD